MLHSLAELLRHEKDFTANASHQLRTPLTGLQLTLESGLGKDSDLRPVLEEALESTRRLHHTVEEVLRLAGAPGSAHRAVPDRPVQQILREAERRWHGLFAQDGRRLVCDTAPDDVRVPGGQVTEILDVLLDNAGTHGRGSVRVAVRDLDDALAFDVTDEGTLTTEPVYLFARGHSGGEHGTGIGLALAADLALSLGGRLILANSDPTTFTLLVPARPEFPARGTPGRSSGQ
ncbi:HAMP domain-containing sensor histidine kinase [Streptomyces sp. NPDC005251]|uniref:sensor histidine kinase n=1 Tax=Streptomyces sp. NPDC005251 TaxID=3157166 RepID=UPI0033BE6CF3